jgi:predicted nucleic acid-binding Zn ribbon protein
MSITYLKDRSVYEDRYDAITVELCRAREETVEKTLGERPPIGADGEVDPANGYYVYSVFYFQFVETVAGERWQKREETIRKWMADDDAKDRQLAEAKPSVHPYCLSCGEDMAIFEKTFLHCEQTRKKADDILFMFECKPCGKRQALWQDGSQWEGAQARCEKCQADVTETHKRRGKTITSTYTCANCGHEHKDVMKLGAESAEAPDPYFKIDLRRFCFDETTGKKFLARKAHLEHIRGLLAQGRQQIGADPATADPVAEAAKAIRQLKIAQVANLLTPIAAKAGYSDFKLGEPQIGREVAVPFGCLDTRPDREDYDSRTTLKKLITQALEGTNWRLMSDGVHHRLGYLNGRLRAYESEDDLRTLAAKQIKGGKTKALAPLAPPPSSSLPSAKTTLAPAPPKRKRRRSEPTIRIRAILHPKLHILIPPGDQQTRSRQRKDN